MPLACAPTARDRITRAMLRLVPRRTECARSHDSPRSSSNALASCTVAGSQPSVHQPLMGPAAHGSRSAGPTAARAGRGASPPAVPGTCPTHNGPCGGVVDADFHLSIAHLSRGPGITTWAVGEETPAGRTRAPVRRYHSASHPRCSGLSTLLSASASAAKPAAGCSRSRAVRRASRDGRIGAAPPRAERRALAR
jgi:hypothetical protein